MARKLRIQYEGAFYHILSRGNGKQKIFRCDPDRELFLATLGEVCGKTGWLVHAYCLMSNHFHLVIQTPRANLVAGMKWFLGTYTARFNRRHKFIGHLFSGRYKSIPVDGSGTGYLKTVCDYVHLNPVRSKLVAEGSPLSLYPWSSYPLYLGSPTSRPEWLHTESLFGEHGIPKDSAAGRREFERRIEARRFEDNVEEWQKLRRGWVMGESEFRKELLEKIHAYSKKSHAGAELRESDVEKARRILGEELKKSRFDVTHLKEKSKGDAWKVRVAAMLRAETTMTYQWIADELHMGTIANVAKLLRTNAKA